MRIVFTADWQAHANNIDQLDKIIDFCIEQCKFSGAKTIVHCGDVKHHYNPVDLRITNWIIKKIQYITSLGIRFIAVLGNHDRASMNSEESWFPTLKAAGAVIVTRPRILKYGKYELAVVPYQPTAKEFKKGIEEVAFQLDHKNACLVFHNEIQGARFNVISDIQEGVKRTRLHEKKFKFCVGGHIHYHQRIGEKTYYVGSPFCHDWNEANQVKGIVVGDLDTGKVRFVASPIPGWYDTSLPFFPRTNVNWKGCTVRVPIYLDSKAAKLTANVQKVEADAKLKYPGANICLAYKLHKEETVAGKKISTDETQAVREYVTQYVPKRLSAYKERITKLVLSYLSNVPVAKIAQTKVSIERVVGKNVLSFPEFDFKYNNRGLVVVTGKNKDWNGNASNGAGKTSFLQLIAIGLAGRTLKKQKADAWTRRGSTGTASIETTLNVNGKTVSILRQRRPTKLVFTVNGKARSTGIGTEGTQKAIERYTGLSWDVIKNGIFVDQQDVSQVLTGTDKERFDIFSKLLCLERYELAFTAIRKDKLELAKQLVKATAIVEALEHIPNELANKAKQTSLLEKMYNDLKKSIPNKIDLDARTNALVNKIRKLQSSLVSSDSEASKKVESLKKKLYSIDQLIELYADKANVCPTCKRPFDRAAYRDNAEKLPPLRRDRESVQKNLAAYKKIASKETDAIQENIEALQDKIRRNDKLAATRDLHLEKLRNCEERLAADHDAIEALRVQQDKLVNATATSRKLKKKIRLLEFSEQALSRTGIPLLILEQFCPALNQACAQFSEELCNNQIQVQFAFEDDKVSAQIINPNGGEEFRDQSKGESRLAGLVVSFAINKVLNPTDLMILDEPGDGLDAYNARELADRLSSMRKSFGTILLTTHNVHILDSLKSNAQIVIQKKNGASKIIQGEV